MQNAWQNFCCNRFKAEGDGPCCRPGPSDMLSSPLRRGWRSSRTKANCCILYDWSWTILFLCLKSTHKCTLPQMAVLSVCSWCHRSPFSADYQKCFKSCFCLIAAVAAIYTATNITMCKEWLLFSLFLAISMCPFCSLDPSCSASVDRARPSDAQVAGRVDMFSSLLAHFCVPFFSWLPFFWLSGWFSSGKKSPTSLSEVNLSFQISLLLEK